MRSKVAFSFALVVVVVSFAPAQTTADGATSNGARLVINPGQVAPCAALLVPITAGLGDIANIDTVNGIKVKHFTPVQPAANEQWSGFLSFAGICYVVNELLNCIQDWVWNGGNLVDCVPPPT